MTAPVTGRTVAPRFSGNVVGMLAMLASMAFYVVNDAFAKLVGLKLPVPQIICLRGAFAFMIILPIAWYLGALRHPQRLFQPTIVIRVIFEVSATGFFLLGLVHMPFAEAISLLQITPIGMTAGAALLLGEKVGWRRWLAAVVGLVGVLLIIKPASEAFNWYSLPLIASVACVVVRDLVTRRIDTSIPTLLLTALSAASVTVFGLVLSIFSPWRAAAPIDIAHIFGAAVFLALGYVTILIALRAGEISVIAPFRYAMVPYSIVTGYLLWGELPDHWALIGVIIVAAAGLYTFHRERTLKAREHTIQGAAADQP